MFVRDGFHFWAFVLAPLWLLVHRLWLALLVIYVVELRLLGVALAVLPARRRQVQLLASLLVALLVGFEAATLWRWTLARRGWKTLGFVVGEDREIAERRFFAEWSQARRRAAAAARRLRRSRNMRRRCGAGRRRRRTSSACSRSREPAMSVAIVDYGSGNLHSAAKAFERAARESGYEQPIVVTSDPDAGRARGPRGAAGRRRLRRLPARARRNPRHDRRARTDVYARTGKPFFGICVGMQLMAERGREYQVTPGLGWIAGEVDRITPSDPDLKIPHMGWNTLNMLKAHPLLDGHSARAGRPARLFRAHLTSSNRRSAAIWWRRPTTAARSPPSSAATTWSARNSIPRRASAWASS